MKLHILSDLHLDFCQPSIPATDADAVVIAGDIAPGLAGLEWAMSEPAFANKPVIFVPGNHEYYNFHMTHLSREFRQFAAAHPGRLHLLDRDELILNGVRFLGATFWTDFHLFSDGTLQSYGDALKAAEDGVNDFGAIHYGTFRFTPSQSVTIHLADREWLKQKMAEPFVGATVVVTHHAPHPGSLAERFRNDPLSPAFVSHLDDSFFETPKLWVHGHSHDSFDYRVNNCRVVCNPRGYAETTATQENASFDAGLVIEV